MTSWLLVLAAGALAALALVIVRLKRRQRLLEKLLNRTNEKLEQLQIRFSWFAPADIVEHLTGPSGSARPYRRPVTILFADIRGFTNLCDRMAPEAVVPVLNGYFERMSVAISENHGRVTELVGDGILALFGALEANPWQAQDAVLAALKMRESLRRYNLELRAAGSPELRIGIGIHSPLHLVAHGRRREACVRTGKPYRGSDGRGPYAFGGIQQAIRRPWPQIRVRKG